MQKIILGLARKQLSNASLERMLKQLPTLVVATVVGLIQGACLAYLLGPCLYPQVERSTEMAALRTSFLAGLGQ